MNYDPLPDGTLHRHSSEVGTVCIKVHVRFCAGADQQWPSLPRQSAPSGRLPVGAQATGLAQLVARRSDFVSMGGFSVEHRSISI
jgi:hypothetical protein